MEIQFEDFGRALRNPVRIAAHSEKVFEVKPI
jgi:hypothetical protein